MSTITTKAVGTLAAYLESIILSDKVFGHWVVYIFLPSVPKYIYICTVYMYVF